MKNIISKILVALFAIYGGVIYAQDIRYVYCSAEFDSFTSTPTNKIPRDEKIIIYSPIFKIDIHDKKVFHSRYDFTSKFVSRIYKDAENNKAHPYVTKSQVARLEGCSVEHKNLDDAIKAYDTAYKKAKNLTYPGAPDKRCYMIGSYNMNFEGITSVYPSNKSPYNYNLYGQVCRGEEALRYK